VMASYRLLPVEAFRRMNESDLAGLS
jgi:hypothetical protein